MIEIISIIAATIITLGVNIIIDREIKNYEAREKVLIILSSITLQVALFFLIYILLTLTI